MNDATEMQLMRAYELIEAGNLEQAKTLIVPILAREKENADAWWIYSHAVTDPQTAKEALDNVLRIDRDYPGARELRDQLANQLVDNVTGTQVVVPSKAASSASAAGTPPELERVEDDDDGGFSLLRILLIAAVFVIIAVVGILLASQGSQNNVSVVAGATSTAVATDVGAQAASTDELMVQNPNSDVNTLVNAAAGEAGATIYASGSTVEGDLVVANICGAQGAVIGRVVDALKLALGRASTSLTSDIQRVGIRVYDCTAGDAPLRVQIAVDTVTANAYANGGLTDTEFSERWTVFN